MIKSSKKQVKILVSGRVQGVGFRMSTKGKAQSLSLNGWVKNLPNGKVKIVAEGEKEKLEKLVDWARKGPTTAKVEDLEVSFSDFKGQFESFQIEY